MSRMILPVCTFVTILGLSLAVASAGDLKQIRATQKIAAEKLAGDVDAAIEKSRTQDPSDAKLALEVMIRRVQDSPDLVNNADKQQFVNRLRVRLNVVENALRAKRIAQDQAPSSTPPRPRPVGNEPTTKGGAYGAASDIIGQRKGTIITQSDFYRERTKGIQAINQGIENSGVLTDKEITFPKNWREITKRREEMVNSKLSDKEVKLLKTLNSVMSVDYDGVKFKSVIEHLMERTKLVIIVDPASLQDAMVDYEADTVTLKFPKMTVRTALKKILGDKGLTYIIKEGHIQVMTPERASKIVVIRTYPIDDLIQPDPKMAMFGPFMGQLQMMQNAQMLINLIQSTVEPTYWQPNGPGSIMFYPPTRSLIVRASAEMHYQLGSPGLFGGR